MRARPSFITRFVLIATAVVLFANMHWTQRFVHATVTTSGGCISLLKTPMESHGKLCLYKDVTLDTWTVTRQYVLEDTHGTSVAMAADDVVGFSYSNQASVFTWRTYALGVACLTCLLLALFGF